MFLDWFKSKKPALKLKANQEVEVEFCSDNVFKNYFTKVLDVKSRNVVLKFLGTEHRPVKLEAGQHLTITTLQDDKLYYFETDVTDAGTREFDIAAPKDNVGSEDVPKFDENCSIEAPVSVEYRAINLTYSQSAQTKSLSLNSLVLCCNIAIPEGTNLFVEIQIPGITPYSFKGRAMRSKPDPDAGGKKKFLCEIEYADDAAQEDRMSIMRYALYLKRREQRRRDRGEDDMSKKTTH
ncbi:MAG: flagellar brake protein [bacterium]|nr:flagellar brake protein [bacterium]